MSGTKLRQNILIGRSQDPIGYFITWLITILVSIIIGHRQNNPLKIRIKNKNVRFSKAT